MGLTTAVRMDCAPIQMAVTHVHVTLATLEMERHAMVLKNRVRKKAHQP